MTPDSNDRWLFLLTLAALPLACTEDVPGEPTTEGTTGTTTAMPSDATAEGSTSIMTTTAADDTSSSGTTVVDESSGGTSSSEGTTVSVDPSTSTGEESTTTGEPQGLCEVWGETISACYGGYYGPMYYINSCYDYLMYVDVVCGPAAAMVFQCQSAGCFVDCSDQYETLDDCRDMQLAIELGCDMIPDVPALGTIGTQCTGFVDQVEVCTAGGFYIPFFSWYVQYNPGYAEYACVNAWVFTYPPPAMGVGDVCGGAYEELLTCLSGLSCSELETAIFDDTYCAAEKDALTCRCQLGA